MKQFDWTPYLREQWQKRDTCGHWIKQFEKDYFVRRALTDASRYTWEKDYLVPFKQLPQEEPLTKEILVETLAQTEPDSRARKRSVLPSVPLPSLPTLSLMPSGIGATTKRQSERYPQKRR